LKAQGGVVQENLKVALVEADKAVGLTVALILVLGPDVSALDDCPKTAVSSPAGPLSLLTSPQDETKNISARLKAKLIFFCAFIITPPFKDVTERIHYPYILLYNIFLRFDRQAEV
jgi:hypothetical protein